ncbi:hypothetical protein AVEN_75850-1 [Araneus ventricosus]|uniref:Uncharacterized protein n=1 Tax=Araneus ventricosus TaxID=182803 RepID=A0A4Y2JJE9_ARAVE|nr:hypothetical protein AVEN_75850-1 [Araneus ventricosus]
MVSSVQQYIRDTFQQQVIGYSGCVEWSPRSPDLNTLDFFLWGYMKQRVYATPPPTLKEIRNRITDAGAIVSFAMLYNVQCTATDKVSKVYSDVQKDNYARIILQDPSTILLLVRRRF